TFGGGNTIIAGRGTTRRWAPPVPRTGVDTLATRKINPNKNRDIFHGIEDGRYTPGEPGRASPEPKPPRPIPTESIALENPEDSSGKHRRDHSHPARHPGQG